jgi:hypothetical protein
MTVRVCVYDRARVRVVVGWVWVFSEHAWAIALTAEAHGSPCVMLQVAPPPVNGPAAEAGLGGGETGAAARRSHGGIARGGGAAAGEGEGEGAGGEGSPVRGPRAPVAVLLRTPTAPPPPASPLLRAPSQLKPMAREGPAAGAAAVHEAAAGAGTWGLAGAAAEVAGGEAQGTAMAEPRSPLAAVTAAPPALLLERPSPPQQLQQQEEELHATARVAAGAGAAAAAATGRVLVLPPLTAPPQLQAASPRAKSQAASPAP